MAYFQTFANAQLSVTKKVLRDFLDEYSEMNISDVLSDFDSLFSEFNNTSKHFAMSKSDYSSKVDVNGPKKSKKSKSSSDKSDHIEGKCGHQTKSGANKGAYCNKNVVDDTEYCKAHQPKEPKQLENPCNFVSASGNPCNKESTTSVGGSRYCGFCASIMTKRLNKQQKNEDSEGGDIVVEKKVEKKTEKKKDDKKVEKKKVVKRDDDSDIESD